MGKNKEKSRQGQNSLFPKNAPPGLSSSRPNIGASLSRDSTPQLPLPYPRNLERCLEDGNFLRNGEGPRKEFFKAALETSYEGIAVDIDDVCLELKSGKGAKSQKEHLTKDRASKKTIFPHNAIEKALSTMEDAGLFRTDVTQPFGLGTKCAKTYVTRCLLGERGTTYKYLGLRMFAHPWDTRAKSKNMEHSKDGNDMNLVQACDTIRQLNETLTERTRFHLSELDQDRTRRGANVTRGRANFDVALINRMENTSELKSLGEGRCSVSWHADSSLEHYSTIAVYHQILKKNEKQGNRDSDRSDTWSLALRVAHNSEGPHASRRGTDSESSIVKETPQLAISLPSGAAYYLLDDFNHHHQHAVIAEGESPDIRYSSTHRLLRESHNVDYVIERCRSVCSNFHKKGPKIWRSEQLLLTEVESEWLRQYYIQGKQHNLLLWNAWGDPIKTLLQYWSQLEYRTKQTIDFLRLAAEGRCGTTDMNSTHKTTPSRGERKIREKRRKAIVTMEDLLSRIGEGTSRDHTKSTLDSIYDPMALLLEERATMRELWLKRERENVFRELGVDFHPLSFPIDFEMTNQSGSKSVDRGSSPMPGTAERLRKIANDLRKLGKAHTTRQRSHLPVPMVFTVKDSPQDDAHAKLPTWTDWRSLQFALEMQMPWSQLLLDGKKKVETRAYSLPSALLGKRIELLQSQTGKPRESSLGNVVSLGKDTHNAVERVGWCIFSRIIRYTNCSDFQVNESDHLVSKDSIYGWKEGTSTIVYGWVVGEYFRYEKKGETRSNILVRRMRSLFELQSNNCANDTCVEAKEIGGKKRASKPQLLLKTKKRKKRY